MIKPVRRHSHTRAHQRIQQEMIRRRHNRHAHEDRPHRRQNPHAPMRTKPEQNVRDEKRISEMQRRHGRDRQLELVRRPRRPGPVLVQHVDEPVVGGQETGRGAAPRGEDAEGKHVLEGKGAADSLVSVARDVGVAVDEEDDAEDDVGVVDFGEEGHQRVQLVEDEALHGQFDVDVEDVFEGEDLVRVVFGAVEDLFVAGDAACRECAQALVDLGAFNIVSWLCLGDLCAGLSSSGWCWHCIIPSMLTPSTRSRVRMGSRRESAIGSSGVFRRSGRLYPPWEVYAGHRGPLPVKATRWRAFLVNEHACVY